MDQEWALSSLGVGKGSRQEDHVSDAWEVRDSLSCLRDPAWGEWGVCQP